LQLEGARVVAAAAEVVAVGEVGRLQLDRDQLDREPSARRRRSVNVVAVTVEDLTHTGR